MPAPPTSPSAFFFPTQPPQRYSGSTPAIKVSSSPNNSSITAWISSAQACGHLGLRSNSIIKVTLKVGGSTTAFDVEVQSSSVLHRRCWQERRTYPNRLVRRGVGEVKFSWKVPLRYLSRPLGAMVWLGGLQGTTMSARRSRTRIDSFACFWVWLQVRDAIELPWLAFLAH